MRHCFDAAYLAALAATAPYWLYQSFRTGKYRRDWKSRCFGPDPLGPSTSKTRVWIHAVSVGEVALLRPLVDAMRRDRPDLQFFLSSTTDAGLDYARQKLPDIVNFRAPLDFSWAVGRAFRSIKPHLLLLVERELWPNLLLQAKQQNVPVAVINARLSDSSHRTYRRMRAWLQQPLSAIHWWGAQTTDDADRIVDLYSKAPKPPIQITGSIKFDGAQIDPNNPGTKNLRKILNIAPMDRVLVAGSTQHPEESILLDAWPELAQLDPTLRLILVPRHPHRFQSVAVEIERRGLPFVRRTQCSAGHSGCPPIILLDSIGELRDLWGLATIGYVGGSLENSRGGQSMIEPAAFAVPTCFGPNTTNFRATVQQLLSRKSAVQVANRHELKQVLLDWIRNPDEASAIGTRARDFVLSQLGALHDTQKAVAQVLRQAPNPRKAVA